MDKQIRGSQFEETTPLKYMNFMWSGTAVSVVRVFPMRHSNLAIFIPWPAVLTSLCSGYPNSASTVGVFARGSLYHISMAKTYWVPWGLYCVSNDKRCYWQISPKDICSFIVIIYNNKAQLLCFQLCRVV